MSKTSTIKSKVLKVTINYQCEGEVDWEDAIAEHLNSIAMDSGMTDQPIELKRGCKIEDITTAK